MFIEDQTKEINQLNNEHLHQKDEKHIRDVLDILIQNNDMKVITQQQLKQELYDQRYYEDTIKQLLKLISYNKANVQNILFVNNLLNQDEQFQSQQQNIISPIYNPQYEYLEIIHKLDLFQMDIQVLQSISETYQIIDKEAEQMKQKLKAQLNQQSENQLQKKLEFLDWSYQNFQVNTKTLKKFQSIEQLEQSKQTAEEKFQKQEAQYKQLSISYQDLQQKMEKLDKNLQNRDRENECLKQLKQQNANEIEKLKQQITNEIEKLKQQNTNEIEKLKQQNANEIEKLKQYIENQKKISETAFLKKDQEIHSLKQQNSLLENSPHFRAHLRKEQLKLQMKTYANKLEFSSFNKHSELQVLENERRKIKSSTNSGWYFGLCDQKIPNQGVTKVCFKILGQEQEAFMLGIGKKEIMQKYQFYDCNKDGRGTQILVNYEGRYIDYTGQKREAFKFWSNDIIMIEVDMSNKFIRWTKQNTKEGFAIEIKLEGDFYFCVGIWYKGQSVEILEDFF